MPAEPRALFALSMADMVDVVGVLLIEMRVEMYSAREKMECDECWIRAKNALKRCGSGNLVLTL